MKLKVTYQRSSGAEVDVVITTDAAATAGEIARELVETDPEDPRTPEGTVTLSVTAPGSGPMVLSHDRIIADAAVASGHTVRVVPVTTGAATAGQQAAQVLLRVTAGPDRGKEFRLPAGSFEVGRDVGCDVVLNDSFVSKRHARIDVSSSIDVVDLNSANGILVDGQVVSRVAALPGQVITVGDTGLEFHPLRTSPDVTPGEIRNGGTPFNRSPRVEVRYPSEQHARPAVPGDREPQMFPWLMMFPPVVMGVSMYAITGNPMSLIFVLMAPMMMVGNFTTTRMRNKRRHATEVARFEAQLAELEETLGTELPREQRIRQAEVPTVAEVFEAGLERDPLLWTRRPEHWSFLHLRLGTGVLASRNTIAEGAPLDEGLPEYRLKLEELQERHRWVRDVPVIESATYSGALGVVGSAENAYDALRGLLVQLVGLHSPSEVVVTAVTSPSELPHVDWLSWLPHTTSPQSPVAGIHLADSQATASQVADQLEELIKSRLDGTAVKLSNRGPLKSDISAVEAGASFEDGNVSKPPQTPVVVLVITEHAPIDRARFVQLSEAAADAGILPLWVSSRPRDLPAVCRTYVDVSAGLGQAEVNFVRHGVRLNQVVVEGVSADNARRFAHALSPLTDAGAVTADVSDLPRMVSMTTLLGPEIVSSSAAVVERWRQNLSIHQREGAPKPRRRAGTLRALVGQAGADAMHLDLRTQGPHALVGGTTGAGKSEFLQAWVLGMAAEYSPDRVSFLFVDYKGGAAFADCVKLPHCVGLVTDLSPHLVRRALTSLRAELHHREHLLNRKKAKDLLELEKRGDPESPPALILVIDEFAALAKEVPEFVDGVVDIAQRGRSLGIHLIMATQRPAGVIKDNLRANTNLRVALRMADESDSTDVIGSADAAHFDPSVPGRGIVKTGPGRLTGFQSAYAGGHTTEGDAPASVTVQPLGFGVLRAWERPESALDVEPKDLGPSDLVRTVTAIEHASRLAEIPTPRRPWLDELSTAYDLAILGPRTDTEMILGVADIPQLQTQKLVHFRPDVDGNLAVYGTGGSGKSVLLRTLAAGAGVTPRGGPVEVYGLDFAAGGLRMLEALPHVGSVVSGDDHERVGRLLRRLREIAEQRARDFPAVDAGSITEYRRIANRPDEPRILLLVDNFPAFREAYETGGIRLQLYATFQQLLSEGRQLGIHVVFTADRPASVPGSVASSVPRRVVLRLADESSYLVVGVPTDVLDVASPPGRAVVDGMETQLAILGGSGNVADQSQALGKLSRAMDRLGREAAPAIRSLPHEVSLDDLPTEVGGQPVLGMSDDTLAPIGFDPSGVLIIGGPSGSGRSTAVVTLAQSLLRWDSRVELIYLGNRRSVAFQSSRWEAGAFDPESVAVLAREIAARMADRSVKHRIAVVVESLPDFLSTPADSAIVELARVAKRSEHLLIAEADIGSWSSMMPLYSEMRSARRGILLQPEPLEGDSVLRTPFPRASRSEFPPGRGMAVLSGRAVRVQLPLPSRGVVPIDAASSGP
ncbi:FtsK/SpoIIIE domain-containing protein [Nocardioides gilvus]|uniref:FtsK/SpoIIIE domain-containing protein n=1 Tax=Nocardioides gilvus TaxID=1735589 RepID=UPI000D74E689|nr:FtsK/SpoIIIE domain-containing protein [Nocardioides gilvus]